MILKVTASLINNRKKPKLQKDHRFQKNLTNSSSGVLLYPEGLVTLNNSACEILSLCNGNLSITQIKDTIYEKYQIIDPIQLEPEIDNLLKDAYFKNWITLE